MYVTSKGESDSIWNCNEGSSPSLGCSGVANHGRAGDLRDGSRIAFVARRNRQTILYVANEDGTHARLLTSSLQVRGAPAWAPDGQSITVGAMIDEVPHLFSVPLDGSAPRPIVHEHSVDPVWSSDGTLLGFGTRYRDDVPSENGYRGCEREPKLKLTLSRGSRHLSFLPGKGLLVVLRGELSQKDLWLVGLETGAERQLTHFAPDFNVRDFDISPDGREIVVEQMQEHSDIVLIDLLQR